MQASAAGSLQITGNKADVAAASNSASSANAGSPPACGRATSRLASVALHGEPGHLVTSVFEPAPPAHYLGRDPVAVAQHAQQQLRDLHLEPAGALGARAELAAAGGEGRGRRPQQTAGAQQPGPGGVGGGGAGAAHAAPRRPHSQAFAELQRRKEQRAARAGGPAPFPFADAHGARPRPAAAGLSDLDRHLAALAATTSAAAAAVGAAAASRTRPSPAAAAAAAAAACVRFEPSREALAALSTAAAREALHHTGTCTRLYHGTMSLLGEGALRAAAAALPVELGRYLVELQGWEEAERRRLGLAAGGPQPAEQQEGSGKARTVDSEAVDGSSSTSIDESEDESGSSDEAGDASTEESSSDSEDSSDLSDEEEEDSAAAHAERQQQQHASSMRPHPSLHLGPAELLLLSIHPLLAPGPLALVEGLVGEPATPGGTAASYGAAEAAEVAPSRAAAAVAARPCGPPPEAIPAPGAAPRWRSQLPLRRLHLELPFRPHGKEAAATTIALCVLLAALRRHAPLSATHGNAGAAGSATATGRTAGSAAASGGGSSSINGPRRRRARSHGPEGAGTGGGAGGGVGPGPGRAAGEGVPVWPDPLRPAAAELESVALSLAAGEYMQVVAQSGPQRLGHLVPLWGHVLGGLAALAAARPGLAEVVLAWPPGVVAAAALERLQRAAADPGPTRARRLAVLMGAHPRLGADSPLRLLPAEVLELVLRDALPLKGPPPSLGRAAVAAVITSGPNAAAAAAVAPAPPGAAAIAATPRTALRLSVPEWMPAAGVAAPAPGDQHAALAAAMLAAAQHGGGLGAAQPMDVWAPPQAPHHHHHHHHHQVQQAGAGGAGGGGGAGAPGGAPAAAGLALPAGLAPDVAAAARWLA
ncbi:hypothetical protein HXX76_002396 [Chlamydomonas incerta]|uniref:Uncharacterized protein n=1 Tax=Chlamydomonas incerta TaxID=51695 RepID=A0A835TQM7_CHLIN|nr:hypothetical protein HXX76_002396 [Chlamydomonas incerta]|eukprot:KAG2442310.1 hypothetical protein HXX76_002396 [Chlamydomonas incerta]